MHKSIIVLLLLLAVSCKESSREMKASEETRMSTPAYPAALTKVLEAHGGLEKWKTEKTLVFEIPDSAGAETHTIDLSTRKDKTSTANFDMGYDGKDIWLQDKKSAYQGNPFFMHNLMFYFYAMPFVLADSGITYGKAEDLTVDGNTYPGIKITFENGVGASSDDEYYLHYDTQTYKMVWLGYKATFGSDKKPDQPNWISYNTWKEVDGILLPTSITWHAVEDGKIKEGKNTVSFENVSLSETAKPDTFFAKPENAVVVDAKK